jgi:predicted acyltransferase
MTSNPSDSQVINSNVESLSTQTLSPSLSRPAQRSLALDVFRGVTVALMLLVNNVALDNATPAPLLHAPWGGGVRLADLVFPWFLFATGLSIPFAFSSLQRRRPGYASWIWKVLQRSFWLFALGCLVTSVVARDVVISLGVLQLIGLAYLVAASLQPLPLRWRLSSAAVLLVGYWAALRFLPIPGANVGTFEEGQNLVRFVNSTYLEPIGLRGLPSVIPTSALVLIASWVGELTRGSRPAGIKATSLFVVGAILAGIGLLWDLDLEMNKTIWTPSYILFTAGLGTALIGLLTWLETLRFRAWSFVFVVFGSNALIAYIAPILVKVWILQSINLRPGVSLQDSWLEGLKYTTNPVFGGWIYTISYIALTWLALLVLLRRKLFLRV